MTTNNELILSIDAGTQSIRAVLIDTKGNIIEIVKTEIEAYFSIKPGWAEQEPEYFWTKLSETTKKLLQNTSIKIDRIKAVTITSQRGTVINLDKKGKALRPAIVWLDQRQAKQTNYPSKTLGMMFGVINLKNSILTAVKNAECNWLIQNQLDIWNKTHKYLYLSGYYTYKLIGDFVDSIGNTVGYMPFDYKKQKWTSEKHMNFKMFPVDDDKKVRLIKPSEVLGEISKKASEETGIPAGLPLIAAASDKACEVLGSGVYEPDVACLSYGTTATVQTTRKKYIEVTPFFPAYPSAIPEYFNTEIMIYRGFWLINWFKKQFGYREIAIARSTGKATEQLFDEMIKKIPAGSMGLTIQPYWSPGIRNPGVEAKGAIIGFGDVHTRAHIYKAILEGLAYALKDGLLKTEQRTKTKIKKIIVSGGGSQSEQAMQLTADIFDLKVERPHTYETSALGAAINAAVGMKFFPDFKTAINEMCRTNKVYKTIPKNRDIYKKLFEDVYLKMYKKLQPLYNNIRNITGYPK